MEGRIIQRLNLRLVTGTLVITVVLTVIFVKIAYSQDNVTNQKGFSYQKVTLEEKDNIKSEQEIDLTKSEEKIEKRVETTSRGTEERPASPLINVANPDNTYYGLPLNITHEQRVTIQKIVMGEAESEGYIGKVLVAQAIHDAIIEDNSTLSTVVKKYAYPLHTSKVPDEESAQAVHFVFDEAGYAVKHRIMFYYAPGRVRSYFHETQNLVVEYMNHRVFDRIN